jgi:hypothetical protein
MGRKSIAQSNGPSVLIQYPEQKGAVPEITYQGSWSRQLLDQTTRLMYKHLRLYRLDQAQEGLKRKKEENDG